MSRDFAWTRFCRVVVLLTATSPWCLEAFAQEVAQFTALSPTGLVFGPGGAIWFADQGLQSIHRIDMDGRVQGFPVGGSPQSLAAGGDGNLWYTLMSPARIGRMTLAGEIREFSLPEAFVQPHGLAAAPDGSLWFAESDAYRIGRITTSGGISEFPQLPTRSWVGSIAPAPDGSLWFAQPQASTIGRITSSGEVTEFMVTSGGQPLDLAIGWDGTPWFVATFEGRPSVGHISPSGQIEERPVPGNVERILAGSNGDIWLAGYATLERLTVSGAVTEYTADAIYSDVTDLAAGPDGTIWVAVDTDGWGSDGSVLRYSFDTSPCVADAMTLCLDDGRFRATTRWEAADGANGQGRGVTLGTGSGYFWFFDPTNVELVLKVLDGCAANHHYWTFAAGLTRLAVTLTVTETGTGASRTYTSSPGAPLAPVQDTAAFASCP